MKIIDLIKKDPIHFIPIKVLPIVLPSESLSYALKLMLEKKIKAVVVRPGYLDYRIVMAAILKGIKAERFRDPMREHLDRTGTLPIVMASDPAGQRDKAMKRVKGLQNLRFVAVQDKRRLIGFLTAHERTLPQISGRPIVYRCTAYNHRFPPPPPAACPFDGSPVTIT